MFLLTSFASFKEALNNRKGLKHMLTATKSETFNVIFDILREILSEIIKTKLKTRSTCISGIDLRSTDLEN